MTPFRWKNCYADVLTSKHDLTIESYFNDVIVPALDTLNEKIEALGKSDWPGAVFAQADMTDMLRESKLAFGLAIQSIWERQLREYLRGCAGELLPGEPIGAKIERADWKALRKYFRKLRGIDIEAFPSFDILDLLQHLGNACRHGDGDSAAELARRSPDLWQNKRQVPPMPGMPSDTPLIELPATVAQMDIPAERLHAFVSGIAEFWRDAGYIYKESIERKDPHLAARLVEERATRSWVPQMPVGDS
jgi:hypothetical protein